MRVLSDAELDLVGGGTYVPGYGWIITGTTPGYPTVYNPYPPTGPGSGGVGVGFPGGYPVQTANSDRMTGMWDTYGVEVKIGFTESLTQQETAAVAVLKQAIVQYSAMMNNAAFQAHTFSDGQGHSFSGQEVSTKWLYTDFMITKEVYTNGGVGKTNAVAGSNDVLLEINMQGLMAYTGNSLSVERTLAYIAHEMTHASNTGIAANTGMYSNSSEGGTAVTQSEWLANEQLAWSGAQAILASANHAMPFVPIEGFGSPFVPH